MERLTEIHGEFNSITIMGCSTIFGAKPRKGAFLANAIVRLAAYEDTGMTPEEVAALKARCEAAEKDLTAIQHGQICRICANFEKCAFTGKNDVQPENTCFVRRGPQGQEGETDA